MRLFRRSLRTRVARPAMPVAGRLAYSDVVNTVIHFRSYSHANYPLRDLPDEHHAGASYREVAGGISSGYLGLVRILRFRSIDVAAQARIARASLSASGSEDSTTNYRKSVLAEFTESDTPLPSRRYQTDNPTPNGDR